SAFTTFAALSPAGALVVPTVPGLLRPASELLLDLVSQLPLAGCRLLPEAAGLLVQRPELLSQFLLTGHAGDLLLVAFVGFAVLVLFVLFALLARFILLVGHRVASHSTHRQLSPYFNDMSLTVAKQALEADTPE
ncbi:MAG: hypothetical protein JF587_25650, partial [Catenulisporales bacterium]|nr:hypothetical protein [Catenulisporales bacterium]